MKKIFLIGAKLFATLCSVHASGVPVMIVQLESTAQGIKVLSEEVRDIDYKKSRSDEKAKNSGKFHRARSGGWVAQIIRADGTIESERAIEDPRQQHGEFSYAGARTNERVELQAESGAFTIQIPVTSEQVSLRIVDRQAHKTSAAPAMNSSKTLNKTPANVTDEDVVKGEFKLGEQSK
jgi:hypothetical protein